MNENGTAPGKRISLLWKITIGFVAGILFGFLVGPVVSGSPLLSDYVMPFLDLVGKVFLRLLMMLIVPLVFSSLVAGAASVGDVKKLGRIGIKTLVLYLVTTAIAIVIGLALGNIINAGGGMNIPADLQAEARAAKPLLDVILDIFPSNPLDSMVKANMLQIIVFALFFGVACIMAGERGRKIADIFESVAEVMYSVTHIVMGLAPYGVFALIAITAARYGLSILAPFAKVIGAVYLGCIVHAVLIYSGMITLFCRRSPMWYFKGIQEAAITAFVTRSSSGTLPVTWRTCARTLACPRVSARLSCPLARRLTWTEPRFIRGYARCLSLRRLTFR